MKVTAVPCLRCVLHCTQWTCLITAGLLPGQQWAIRLAPWVLQRRNAGCVQSLPSGCGVEPDATHELLGLFVLRIALRFWALGGFVSHASRLRSPHMLIQEEHNEWLFAVYMAFLKFVRCAPAID